MLAGVTHRVATTYGNWIAVAALVAVVLMMSAPKLSGPIDLRYDGSVYYILGTSLAEGHGYRLLNEPGAIQAVQYPPFLPVLIALHQLALGSNDPFVVGPVLRITFHVLYLALVLLAYALAQRFVSREIALLVGVLTALNVYSYYLADLCFTEIPYTVISLVFLLCAGGDRRWHRVVSGVLAVAAYLLRTSGLALLVAWVLDALWERRFRAALLRGAIAAIPITAWQVYVESVKVSEEYRTPAYQYQRAPWQFYNVTYAENLALEDPYRPELGTLDTTGAVKRVVNNAIRLPLSLGEGASVPRDTWRWPIFLLLRMLPVKIGDYPWSLVLEATIAGPLVVGVLVLIGGVSMLRGRERMLALYVAGSLGLICLTPWPEQITRYLMPLLPLLALALVRGTEVVARSGRSRFPAVRWVRPCFVLPLVIVPVIAVQALTAFWTYSNAHQLASFRDRNGHDHMQRLFYFDHQWQGYERALRWLEDVTDRNDTISTTCPPYLHLRTGRLTVMPPFEADLDRCLAMLDDVPVDYVVIDELELIGVAGHYAEPALRSAPVRWQVVYEDDAGGVRIYGRAEPSG